MEKIKDYVFEKINKEGYCIVIGSEDMIDDFSDSFGIRINILMADFRTKDNKIKSESIKIFNSNTQEVMTFGLVKKNDIKNIILGGRKEQGIKETKKSKEDIENIIAIMLEKGRNINIESAKSKKEKKELIDKFFRIPDEKMNQEIKKIIVNKKYKNDEYRGYV